MEFLCRPPPAHLDFICGRGQVSAAAAGKPAATDQGRVRSKSIDHRAKCTDRKEQPMLDVILIAGGIGFFILSIAYAYGCDRL